jgi:hypothetical protein
MAILESRCRVYRSYDSFVGRLARTFATGPFSTSSPNLEYGPCSPVHDHASCYDQGCLPLQVIHQGVGITLRD